jgi:hypothetical protein
VATISLNVRMESPEFAALPSDERANVMVLEDVMKEIDAAARKLAVCKKWALRNGHRRGWSAGRLYTKYYGWVASGRTWTFLINQARVPKTPSGERRGFAEAFKRYCEENQRASKPAWRAMLRDLRRGVNIPGVGTWRDVWSKQYPGERLPEKCPSDWTPVGWLYSNAMRKFKSTKFELVVMRKGLTAARQFAPAVYSTRVGLLPGMIYEFDDVWHDLKIAVPGINRKLLRALEFACIDVASTQKISWGMKPQILREDGSREGLGKALFKATIADVLCNKGWHPKGCQFVLELGTASLTDVEQQMITRLTDGAVTFREPKVLGQQVLRGMFRSQGKGNFKAKALIEGGHRLIHYEGANLPAQTGALSRVDEPEQMYGLDKYAERVLKVWERVPQDQRDQLWYGGAMTFTAYRRLVADLYEIIYDRRDHDIEGWEQNEWMTQEWSIDGRGDWRAAGDIRTLSEAMQQIGKIALMTPGLYRLRRMSPMEVWQQHSSDLVRLPHWAICDFLWDACYRKVRVGNNGLIEFQDRDMTGSAMKLRYVGLVEQPDGTGCRLAPGSEYGLYVLPHDMTKSVIVEAKTRAVLGIAPAWSAVDPRNIDQVKTMQAAQAQMIALQSQGVRERHAERSDELVVRREENDLLLAGLQTPRKRANRPQVNKQARKKTGRVMAALSQGGTVSASKEGTGDEW